MSSGLNHNFTISIDMWAKASRRNIEFFHLNSRIRLCAMSSILFVRVLLFARCRYRLPEEKVRSAKYACRVQICRIHGSGKVSIPVSVNQEEIRLKVLKTNTLAAG